MNQLHEYDTPECDELEKLMCLTGHHEMKLAKSLEQRLAACRDALIEIANYNPGLTSGCALASIARKTLTLTLTAPKP